MEYQKHIYMVYIEHIYEKSYRIYIGNHFEYRR